MARIRNAVTRWAPWLAAAVGVAVLVAVVVKLARWLREPRRIPRPRLQAKTGGTAYMTCYGGDAEKDKWQSKQTASGSKDFKNTVAVHEMDWDEWKKKKVWVTYKDKDTKKEYTKKLTVNDYCADKDCEKDDKKCCTRNRETGGGFLIDIHAAALEKHFGIDNCDSFAEKITWKAA